MRRFFRFLIYFTFFSLLGLATARAAELKLTTDPSPPLPPGWRAFPDDNIWNKPVDTAPLHPKSAQWMDTINGHSRHPLHPDFGYIYNGHINGIPYSVVGNNTPKVH